MFYLKNNNNKKERTKGVETKN